MIPRSHYPAFFLVLILGLVVSFVGPESMTTQMALAQPPGTPLDTTADAALGQTLTKVIYPDLWEGEGLVFW